MSIRLRVLVVDDDAVFRAAVTRMLASSYDVEQSPDGADAVERVARGEKFDLVLMDLVMPRMNGRDALERLLEIAPDVATRTLLMFGGTGDFGLRDWVGSLGEGRVLYKPFSSGLLREMLIAVIAANRVLH